MTRALRPPLLVISGAFVGETVHHSDAQKRPFILPAIELNLQRARDALTAYVGATMVRLAVKEPA